jgi:phosphonate transport system ATP-binding protein
MKLRLTGVAGRHPAAALSARAALQGIDLEVASGEQLALIGPSGAGKTTLLHLMACALQPSSGTLAIDGKDIESLGNSALQHLRARLFLAPQVPPLPPRQRVVTAVLAGRLPQMSLLAALRSLVYPAQPALARDALAAFDLADKIFDRVDRLSGGERQRVGLARLLASSAHLLLVDEPLSALDPTRARQAMETLTRTATERRATLVTSLHQVDMALNHFPRIVGLRNGQKVFDVPSAKVTSFMLQELYADHPEELNGPVLPNDDTSVSAPVAMGFR